VLIYSSNAGKQDDQELVDSIQSERPRRFIPPPDVIDPFILGHKDFTSFFTTWLRQHKIKMDRAGRAWYVKKKDLEKARTLLMTEEEQKKLPFRQQAIPAGINTKVLSLCVKRKKRTGQTLILNALDRVLNVPSTMTVEQVKDFFNSARVGPQGEEGKEGCELLGDYISECGEDAVPSNCFVDVFTSPIDGFSRCYCITCVLASLRFAVGEFYNDLEEECQLDKIFCYTQPFKTVCLVPETSDKKEKSVMFPTIPLGQLMFFFVHDRSVANYARTWMTAHLVYGLTSSDQCVRCPQHPSIVQRKISGKDLKCLETNCPYYYCHLCFSWHMSRKECKGRFVLPPGMLFVQIARFQ